MHKQPNKWFCQLLTCEDTGVPDYLTLADERAQMLPEIFAQDYYCSFSDSQAGAYYDDLMNWLREVRTDHVGATPA